MLVSLRFRSHVGTVKRVIRLHPSPAPELCGRCSLVPWLLTGHRRLTGRVPCPWFPGCGNPRGRLGLRGCRSSASM